MLEKVPAANNDQLKGGRPAASKTGTWEQDEKHSSENGDAWTVGFTPQVATAVWVGNVKGRDKLRDKSGAKIGGGGMPGAIWKRFMDEVHAGLKLPEKGFPERKNTGDPDKSVGMPGAGASPTPPPDTCILPIFCPDPGGGPGGGGPGGGGPGGGDPGLPPRSPRPGG